MRRVRRTDRRSQRDLRSRRGSRQTAEGNRQRTQRQRIRQLQHADATSPRVADQQIDEGLVGLGGGHPESAFDGVEGQLEGQERTAVALRGYKAVSAL